MCYRFELLEFEDCLFENVDATYILHLEGNGRLEKIHEQLKTYHPSKKVYIVYNKGYKKCHKDLVIQRTTDDLVHANMTVFEHAQQYKHVLVLEDDFIFNKDVANHAIHVDNFLKRDTMFVYHLGGVPLLAVPIDIHHYRSYSFASHANIYSSSSRELLLDNYRTNKSKIENIDYYIYTVLPIYMYHKPVCYQTFPMTENRKNWFKNSSGVFSFADMVFNTFISCTNLENEPEPGFSIIYFLAKLIPILLLLLVVWILYRFFPVFKIIKLKKRK
uniref:Glycosyltransferase n=1 Tax=viral metagenome TaxID=1070528 RepID=A0A6C0HXQ4_9ZZZZ